ncbi:MAG: MmgE/PrpD family protein [bacterium]
MSQNSRPWPATREIARRIAEADPAGIGDAALGRAREAVVDTLGVTLAGMPDESAQLVLRLAREEGGSASATVVGEGDRTSASWAAFVNGVAGHALDFDDVDFVMLGHPSVTLAPALIALAEERGLGGSALLASYAVGFELLHLLGRALNPKHYRRGFHATATLGAVGAAGACAHLMGLDAGRTRNALSLAASEAAGLVCNFGTMTKPFHAGQAARAGLVAARLAGMGFTAAEDTLETGFTAALAAEGIGPGAEEFADWEAAAEGWGEPWDIERGVCVKIHPCCALTHPGIDAMLSLCERESVRHEDVEALGARASTMTLKVLRYKTASTGLEGKFSMPFCLASAVVDGEVGVRQFRGESVARPEIDSLQRIVEFELDPELAAAAPESERTEVWVRLKGGRELRAREEIARGHIDRPIDQGELRRKFVGCASDLLGETRAEAAWEGWWNMGRASDIGDLTPLLVAS